MKNLKIGILLDLRRMPTKLCGMFSCVRLITSAIVVLLCCVSHAADPLEAYVAAPDKSYQ